MEVDIKRLIAVLESFGFIECKAPEQPKTEEYRVTEDSGGLEVELFAKHTFVYFEFDNAGKYLSLEADHYD